MKKVILFIFQSLGSACLLLLLLEGTFFVLGTPRGASDFVERTILQEDLKFRKPSGQYRILVYGESTIHGAGYAPVSSPVKWLDAYLKDFLPGRDIKVVNFGRLGEQSSFIAQSFLDTLQYKPDLVIFYLGHNTFYPDNRVDFVKKKESTFTHSLKGWLRHSRFLSAVVRETIRYKISRHGGKNMEAMGEEGIETFAAPIVAGDGEVLVPGSADYLENVRFFQENIGKIIKSGREKRIPALFMKPVCNLKDYHPNFSVHSKLLTSEKSAQWEQLDLHGKEAATRKDALAAIAFFEKAFAIDPAYADTSFRLGQLYFRMGEIEKARAFFESARDSDAVMRRAPKEILNVYDDLAKRELIHYFNTEKALIAQVPGGIMGWPLIEDNVHFSMEGQAFVGRALADEIAQDNWIAPRSEWKFERERSREAIKKELGISSRTVFLNYCSVISYLGTRYDDRLEFAQKAWDLFPEDPVAQRHLAWAHWLLGEKDKALHVYKILGKKDPEALEAVFRAQPFLRNAFEAFNLRSQASGN